MTRYFCNRCGIEVGVGELRQISISLPETLRFADACSECASQLKAAWELWRTADNASREKERP